MYLDFLKVLRFSFPVAVVGPSVKDFYPLQWPNLQVEFSSSGFYPITNGFTHELSIIPNHATLNLTWTVLIQIQLNCVFFVGCISISFYSLYSNTKLYWVFYLPPFEYFTKAGFSWKKITDFFVFVLFLCFLSWPSKPCNDSYVLKLDWIIMKGQAQKHVETKLTNITRRHFCSLLNFFIERSFNTLFTFSYRKFVSVFCLIDILWQLMMTRDRNTVSSHQNDVTWSDFLQRKQVKLSLSHSLLPQKK